MTLNPTDLSNSIMAAHGLMATLPLSATTSIFQVIPQRKTLKQ